MTKRAALSLSLVKTCSKQGSIDSSPASVPSGIRSTG
jgi:hypothetical protein